MVIFVETVILHNSEVVSYFLKEFYIQVKWKEQDLQSRTRELALM